MISVGQGGIHADIPASLFTTHSLGSSQHANTQKGASVLGDIQGLLRESFWCVVFVRWDLPNSWIVSCSVQPQNASTIADDQKPRPAYGISSNRHLHYLPAVLLITVVILNTMLEVDGLDDLY